MASIAARRALIQVSLIGVFVVGILIGNVRAISLENWSRWLILSVVTGLVTTLVIDAAWLIRLRTAEGRPLGLVGTVAVSMVVSVVLVATGRLMMRQLDLTPEYSDLVSAVASIVTITIIGTATSVFMAGRRLEGEHRERILEDAIAVTLARQDIVDIANRVQMELDLEIDDALAPARMRIEKELRDQEHLVDDSHWAAIADELRTAAQHTVRPLSKRLWSNTAAKATPFQASVVLRNIVTQQPFRPLILSLIFVATALASALSLYGWWLGITTIALGVALIYIILGSANAAMKRWPTKHLMIFISGSLALQLGALVAFPLREWRQLQPYTWGEATGAILIGLILILLTSGAGSLRTYREQVARNFQLDVDQEMIEAMAASRHVAHIARESAQILHGSVQTRLIACAAAIDRASEISSVRAFRTALQEAHTVLAKRSVAELGEPTTLHDEVQRKAGLWSGLCDISIWTDPLVADTEGSMARDVGRVVEEGLTNAIRHGRARTISVRISYHEGAVAIVVDDDGIGPTHGKAGLGSSLLHSLSNSWELTALPRGARLSVQLS